MECKIIDLITVKKYDGLASIYVANKRVAEVVWRLYHKNFKDVCAKLRQLVENGYDTQFGQYASAFPVLKELGKLTNEGNLIYEREIKKQLKNGTIDAIRYLIKYGFIYDFGFDMLSNLFDANSYKILEKYFAYAYNNEYDVTLYHKDDRGLTHTPGGITIDDRKKVVELHLRGGHLKSFPEEFTNLEELEILSLDDNQIRKIPDSIIKLKHLRRLDLVENKIEVFPESLCKLEKVEIDLFDNPIKKIPDSIKSKCKKKDIKILKITNS